MNSFFARFDAEDLLPRLAEASAGKNNILEPSLWRRRNRSGHAAQGAVARSGARGGRLSTGRCWRNPGRWRPKTAAPSRFSRPSGAPCSENLHLAAAPARARKMSRALWPEDGPTARNLDDLVSGARKTPLGARRFPIRRRWRWLAPQRRHGALSVKNLDAYTPAMRDRIDAESDLRTIGPSAFWRNFAAPDFCRGRGSKSRRRQISLRTRLARIFHASALRLSRSGLAQFQSAFRRLSLAAATRGAQGMAARRRPAIPSSTPACAQLWQTGGCTTAPA